MIRMIAAGLVLVAVPAAAQDPVPATAAPAKPKLICKREVAVGTRLTPRVCRTKEQWANAEGDRRQQMLELADRFERNGRESSPYASPVQ